MKKGFLFWKILILKSFKIFLRIFWDFYEIILKDKIKIKGLSAAVNKAHKPHDTQPRI